MRYEVASFAASLQTPANDHYQQAFAGFGSVPVPSYDYYYQQPEEDMPSYRIELAKSTRSACSQKGKAKKCGKGKDTKKGDPKDFIAKGEVRVGSYIEETGACVVVVVAVGTVIRIRVVGLLYDCSFFFLTRIYLFVHSLNDYCLQGRTDAGIICRAGAFRPRCGSVCRKIGT